MPKHRKGVPTPELAAEYLAGATSVELAEKYDMTPSAVCNRLARAGVPIRPAKRRTIYDDATVTASIVSAYQQGEPMDAIAERMKIGRGTVWRAIKAAGAHIRPQGLRRRTVRVPPDPLQLGYLCGLFDGEGNLQVKNRPGSVAAKIAIYSTTPQVMQWLVKTIGGTVRWDSKRTERKGWLPIAIWSVYRTNDVAVLLQAMRPHLQVKRKAADAVLRLIGMKIRLHDSPPTITQSNAGEVAAGR